MINAVTDYSLFHNASVNKTEFFLSRSYIPIAFEMVDSDIWNANCPYLSLASKLIQCLHGHFNFFSLVKFPSWPNGNEGRFEWDIYQILLYTFLWFLWQLVPFLFCFFFYNLSPQADPGISRIVSLNFLHFTFTFHCIFRIAKRPEPFEQHLIVLYFLEKDVYSL